MFLQCKSECVLTKKKKKKESNRSVSILLEVFSSLLQAHVHEYERAALLASATVKKCASAFPTNLHNQHFPCIRTTGVNGLVPRSVIIRILLDFFTICLILPMIVLQKSTLIGIIRIFSVKLVICYELDKRQNKGNARDGGLGQIGGRRIHEQLHGAPGACVHTGNLQRRWKCFHNQGDFTVVMRQPRQAVYTGMAGQTSSIMLMKMLLIFHATILWDAWSCAGDSHSRTVAK